MFKLKLSFLFKVLFIATFLATPLILASNAEAREICNRYDRGDRLCYDTNFNVLRLFIGSVPRWAVGEGFMDISGMTGDPKLIFDSGDAISFDKSEDTFQFSEGGNTLLSLSDGTVDLSGMTNNPELCFAEDSCITGGAITSLPSTSTVMGEIQFLFNDLEENKEPAIKFIKRYWDPDPNFKTTEMRLGDTDTTWSQINMYETPSDNELGFEQASFSYGIPGKTYLISTHDEERGTILVMRLSDGMVDLSGMSISPVIKFKDELTFRGQNEQFFGMGFDNEGNFQFDFGDWAPTNKKVKLNFVSGGQSNQEFQFHESGDTDFYSKSLSIINQEDLNNPFTIMRVQDNLLDVSGVIRTAPRIRSSATCDSSTEGGIYYDDGDKAFFGCTDAGWKQLEFTP